MKKRKISKISLILVALILFVGAFYYAFYIYPHRPLPPTTVVATISCEDTSLQWQIQNHYVEHSTNFLSLPLFPSTRSDWEIISCPRFVLLDKDSIAYTSVDCHGPDFSTTTLYYDPKNNIFGQPSPLTNYSKRAVAKTCFITGKSEFTKYLQFYNEDEERGGLIGWYPTK